MSRLEYTSYDHPAPAIGTDGPGLESALLHKRIPLADSPSEDDLGYLAISDPHRQDAEYDSDPNASLTAQSLNSDGTPKRPMNAFMIFARRRRPQVSAANASMRTGEISKILSREWNSMDMTEKQFYLDQAKLLKETFTSKYPDYVYKRRPNNSRRRRRPDHVAGRLLDGASSTEIGDDASASTDHSVDGDEYPQGMGSWHRASLLAPESVYGDQNILGQRSSSYAFAQHEVTYHQQLGPHENRLAYLSSVQNPLGQDIRVDQRFNASGVTDPTVRHPNYYPQSYLAMQGRPHTHHGGYLPEQGTRATDRGRITSATSPRGALASAMPAVVSATTWASNNRSVVASPPSPANPSIWPNEPPASGRISSSHRHQLHQSTSLSQPYSFPTLNSPYYPNSDSSRASSNLAPATSVSGSSSPPLDPSYYQTPDYHHRQQRSATSGGVGGQQAPSYHRQGYQEPASAQSFLGEYSKDANYAQQQPRQSRSLPSVHTFAISQQHSFSSTTGPTVSGASNSPHWPSRGKTGGQ